MAEKKIYICDGCTSYVEAEELWETNFPAPHNVGTSQGHLSWGTTRKRQICVSCLRELMDTFKLSKNERQLEKESFESFALPNAKPI